MTTKPKTRKAAAKPSTPAQRWRLREIRRLLKIALTDEDTGGLVDVLAKLIDRRWAEFKDAREVVSQPEVSL
jgi:hypothetical protein